MTGSAPARGPAEGSATAPRSGGRSSHAAASTAPRTNAAPAIQNLELRIMPVHRTAVPAVHDPPARATVPLDPTVAEEYVHADRRTVVIEAMVVLDDVADAVAGGKDVRGEQPVAREP